jgi:hypothetical protein
MPTRRIAHRSLTVAKLPAHTLILALLFVHRLTSLPQAPTSKPFTTTLRTPPEILIAGLILADIQLSDMPLSATAWAVVTEKPVSQIVEIKTAAVKALNFEVSVNVEAYGVWLASIKRFFHEDKIREAAKGKGALGRFLVDSMMGI